MRTRYCLVRTRIQKTYHVSGLQGLVRKKSKIRIHIGHRGKNCTAIKFHFLQIFAQKQSDQFRISTDKNGTVHTDCKHFISDLKFVDLRTH